MAEIIEDRVKQLSTTVGLNDLTLSSTVTGYKPFSSVCAIGDTFHGCIVAVDSSGVPTGDWETGHYTYSAVNTVARTTVLTSSASSNGKVSFAAGTKMVFIDLVAAQIRNLGTVQTQPSVSPFGQDPNLYTALTFSDEFSGSTIDTTKWSTDLSWIGTNATPNYNVANGSMNIYPTLDGTGNFFSRTFHTKNKFDQTYGFFEVEMKSPVGAGLRPVLAMHNEATEREIVFGHQYCAAPAGSWSTTSLHPTDWQMRLDTNSTTVLVDQRARNFITVPDLSAAFHKFGVRWDATTVRFYFDGTQVGPTATHSNQTLPLYIYIGLWTTTNEIAPIVGSGTLGPSNQYTPQGATNALQVNYVRMWQLI